MVNPLRDPRNLPVAVLTALTMTTSRTMLVPFENAQVLDGMLQAEQLRHACLDHRAGPVDFLAPRVGPGPDRQRNRHAR